MQAVYVVHDRFCTGHYGIGAVVPLPKEHIEYGLVFVHAAPVVAIHHGKLVQIRHHGQITLGIDLVHLFVILVFFVRTPFVFAIGFGFIFILHLCPGPAFSFVRLLVIIIFVILAFAATTLFAA